MTRELLEYWALISEQEAATDTTESITDDRCALRCRILFGHSRYADKSVVIQTPSMPMDRVAFIAYHMKERLMTREEAESYYSYSY